MSVSRHPKQYPLVDDKHWKKKAVPVLRYLQTLETGVSPEDLFKWGSSVKFNSDMLRNVLAWLKFKGFVTYTMSNKKWRAVQHFAARKLWESL